MRDLSKGRRKSVPAVGLAAFAAIVSAALVVPGKASADTIYEATFGGTIESVTASSSWTTSVGTLPIAAGDVYYLDVQYDATTGVVTSLAASDTTNSLSLPATSVTVVGTPTLSEGPGNSGSIDATFTLAGAGLPTLDATVNLAGTFTASGTTYTGVGGYGSLVFALASDPTATLGVDLNVPEPMSLSLLGLGLAGLGMARRRMAR